MRYLPLHFDLKDRQVLVVGGGQVASRKVDLLLRVDACIHLVAPDIDAGLQKRLAQAPHRLTQGGYRAAQTRNCVLVIAATGDQAVNRKVSEDARASNIPVNVVDSPELCTVTFPAIVDRSPLLVSVGSGGASPVLTRYIRELIELTIPAAFSDLAKYLAGRRARLRQTLTDVEQRRRHVEAFLDSPGMELAMQRQDTSADDYLFADAEPVSGEVYVVGAGPGDSDLLTLKALHLMQKADIVLYDSLVSPGVLARTRRDATREFVGKRGGYQSTRQEDINSLLVRLAREGHRVLRLKGGDPLIFGRIGEEITALIEHRIPFQIVPGITAASGCAAAAGIPLTHRDLAQSVRMVTGHSKDGQVNLPWEEFSHANETLVFYMGLGGLATICQQLLAHGRAADTAVAIISKGTTPDQQVLKATLETMPGLVARTQIQTPTLIIVGEVVNFPTVERSTGKMGKEVR